MSSQTMTQIQVKIDSQTKEQAKEILEKIGLNLNTAIKMFCKQVVSMRRMPIEIRDQDGFRPHKAQELREAIKSAKQGKRYESVEAMMKALND